MATALEESKANDRYYHFRLKHSENVGLNG
jgi:hypothetical protein